MSIPKCPHCGVTMSKYEEVKKADGVYGRYKCMTVYCKNCGGRPCTETRLGNMPIRAA